MLTVSSALEASYEIDNPDAIRAVDELIRSL